MGTKRRRSDRRRYCWSSDGVLAAVDVAHDGGVRAHCYTTGRLQDRLNEGVESRIHASYLLPANIRGDCLRLAMKPRRWRFPKWAAPPATLRRSVERYVSDASGEHTRPACSVRRPAEHGFPRPMVTAHFAEHGFSGGTPEIAREDACAPRNVSHRSSTGSLPKCRDCSRATVRIARHGSKFRRGCQADEVRAEASPRTVFRRRAAFGA